MKWNANSIWTRDAGSISYDKNRVIHSITLFITWHIRYFDIVPLTKTELQQINTVDSSYNLLDQICQFSATFSNKKWLFQTSYSRTFKSLQNIIIKKILWIIVRTIKRKLPVNVFCVVINFTLILHLNLVQFLPEFAEY